MASSLWGWVHRLEDEVQEFKKKLKTAEDEAEELKSAKGSLDKLLNAHESMMQRQRQTFSRPAFECNHAAQMLSRRMLESIDKGHTCSGSISSSAADALDAERKKTTAIAGLSKELANLKDKLAYARAQALAEDDQG